MGGLGFVPAACAAALAWCALLDPAARLQLPELGALVASALSFFAIGAADDWRGVTRGRNEGLSPAAKLGAQLLAALASCALAAALAGGGGGGELAARVPALAPASGWATLRLSVGPLLLWPLSLFVFAAESNGANLTDGLDGLAAGLAAAALVAMGVVSHASGHAAAAVFCACLAGACVGFLPFNVHRARLFMGDTGSLALGGALAAVGVITRHFAPLAVATALFALEALSVLLQVGVFKATKGPDGVGRRLFRMAPFHHHLEACGWHETQVVAAAYAASLGLALLAIAVAAV